MQSFSKNSRHTMKTPFDIQQMRLVNRREAIRYVSAILGGVAFAGHNGLLAAIEKSADGGKALPGTFTAADIAFLDEIAETILPETKTPGAKAAKVGAFMALMVTDSYWPAEQKIFREGMRKVDEAIRTAHNVSFMQATPAQRLAVLTTLDHEQKRVMDARDAAERRRKGLAPLPVDETDAKADPDLPNAQNENRPVTAASNSADIPKRPAHYFRMMKELTLLGYFTSELGYTKVMRYVEAPGRYDPCLPYTPGEPAWADHA
jgi:hypothetical protein